MKKYAEKFYKSENWQSCRENYIRKVGGLCERCLEKGLYVPAIIVHHKVHISPNNINDPAVTLCHDNLEALCRDCHAEAHKGKKRYYTDWNTGEVIIGDHRDQG